LSKRKLEMQKKGGKLYFFRFALSNPFVCLSKKSLQISEAYIPCVGEGKRIQCRSVCFHTLLFVMVVSKGAVVKARRTTFLRAMSNRSYFRKIHIPAAMDKLLRALCACKSCRGVVEAWKQETASTTSKQETASTKSKQETASTTSKQESASTTSSEKPEQHEPPLLSTRYRRNQVVQRCALLIKDGEHRSWPVTYEVRVSSGQKHRRFTNGWAALCRGNGFGTGDKLAITIMTCADTDGEGGEGSDKGAGILIRRVSQQDIIPEE